MRSARQIRIRPETKSDASSIDEVTSAAFANAEHTDHNEQSIVRGLRGANHLSVSLVAEDEVTQTIVGHVAVSPVNISDGSENWYGLGPISVLPEYQGNGIGSILIERAMADIQTRHAAGCVVLGSPKYYTRFGFKAEPSLQLPGVAPEYFMALTWRKPTPIGTVTYHKAFEAEEPSYPTGMKAGISGLAFGAFFLLCLLVYYIFENRRRDALYGPPAQLTEEEQAQGLSNKPDQEIESFRYLM
ncbi:hypothetical protein Asppvi_008450 [Aspergillus pseudoviridinutans]|uniref:N-acetyltransferase domain-containing protein n=1 Tax=Aspergillus pseudoviridinutans TaxID=1517512 RepID=A0A9P3BJJ4_9EURO|nr:uncharacterized protein Asppvi_008450 [Aspergillus pseudoviridinutans]GIJ89508.1 hypothetical protein Asppvi_008450 [Aspergillus pseudoviridinutans]